MLFSSSRAPVINDTKALCAVCLSYLVSFPQWKANYAFTRKKKKLNNFSLFLLIRMKKKEEKTVTQFSGKRGESERNRRDEKMGKSAFEFDSGRDGGIERERGREKEREALCPCPRSCSVWVMSWGYWSRNLEQIPTGSSIPAALSAPNWGKGAHTGHYALIYLTSRWKTIVVFFFSGAL